MKKSGKAAGSKPGRVAVKVLDDRGNELLVVKRVKDAIT